MCILVLLLKSSWVRKEETHAPAFTVRRNIFFLLLVAENDRERISTSFSLNRTEWNETFGWILKLLCRIRKMIIWSKWLIKTCSISGLKVALRFRRKFQSFYVKIQRKKFVVDERFEDEIVAKRKYRIPVDEPLPVIWTKIWSSNRSDWKKLFFFRQSKNSFLNFSFAQLFSSSYRRWSTLLHTRKQSKETGKMFIDGLEVLISIGSRSFNFLFVTSLKENPEENLKNQRTAEKRNNSFEDLP